MKTIKILIADDHPIFRRGLGDILLEELPAAKITNVETAEAAIDLIRKQAWDLVLLDINMPGRSGLEIMADVRAARPKLPVLILSAASEEQYAIRVIKAGASGYITKLKAPHEIAAAVHQILAGGIYVSPAVASRMAEHMRGKPTRASDESLTQREMEVLTRIARGKGTLEIGAELSISPQTVSTYRARILEKLGVQTTAEIIRHAFEHKLVDP